MTSDHDTFEQCWFALKEANQRRVACFDRDHHLNVAFAEARAAFVRIRSPRVKASKVESEWDKIPKEVKAPIVESFRAQADLLLDALWVEIELLSDELDRLAVSAKPSTENPSWHLLKTVWDHDYSTQGMGARKYAMEDAKRAQDLANIRGVESRYRIGDEKIRPTGWHDTGMRAKHVVEVFVDDAVDVEIVLRTPMSFRDWVKSCWARGVNPRVMNPFLPFDLEKQLGLDHFGGELKEKQ